MPLPARPKLALGILLILLSIGFAAIFFLLASLQEPVAGLARITGVIDHSSPWPGSGRLHESTAQIDATLDDVARLLGLLSILLVITATGALLIHRDIVRQLGRRHSALQSQDARKRRTLQALPVHLAVIDRHGKINEINQAWREFAFQNGATEAPGIGWDYLAVCRAAADQDDQDAVQALAGIQAVLEGKEQRLAMEYPCHGPRRQRWFLMTATPLGGTEGGAVITHLDITRRKQMELNAQFLARLQPVLMRQSEHAQLLAHALRELAIHLQVDLALFGEWLDDRGELLLQQAYPDARPGVSDGTGNIGWLGEVACGQLRHGAGVVVDDITADPRHASHSDAPGDRDIAALMAEPLSENEAAAGFLAVATREPRHWRPDEVELLRILAGRLHLAVEHVRALAARRDSEQQLAAIIDSAMVGIISVDDQQRIRLFNATAEAIFGLRAGELLGEPLNRLMPDRFRADHAGLLQKFARSGVSRLGPLAQITGLRANGQEFPIEASISQCISGGHKRFTVILRDITQQKRAEMALLDTQADLNRAQSVGHIGSWRMKLQRNELSWSPENYRIFGIAEGTPLTYRSFLDRIHPEDRDLVDRSWQQALRDHAAYDIDHRLLIDGEVKWVRERAELELAADGSVLGAFGTTQDISDRRRAEEALREADRRKDKFLATLAHELRNPLAPIRNAVEILKQDALPASAAALARDVIDRQVQHMVHLINDLLDVNRISRGHLELRRQTVKLASVVEHAIETVRPHLDKAGHHLTVELPDDMPDPDADPVRLAQVLVNLLHNASKYAGRDSGKEGRIAIIGAHDATGITITVRDDGAGFAAEHQLRLFDPFVQLDPAPNAFQKGLGIGLSLARALVELHGGEIGASSPGPGRGSEFAFRLPLPAPATTSPRLPAEEQQRTLPPPQALRVLLADDNPDIVATLAMLLQAFGHQVRTAQNGREALAAAEQQHPDVVLLDIGMPEMDGYESCRQIRARPWGRETFIAALTGWGHDEDRHNSERAGFDAHLTKPIEPATLARLLQSAALRGMMRS